MTYTKKKRGPSLKKNRLKGIHDKDKTRDSGKHSKGSCPRCAMGKAFPIATPVQKKVTVGMAGDAYEKEADDVADKVTSGRQVGNISRIPSGGLAQKQPADSNLGSDDNNQELSLQKNMDSNEQSNENPVQSSEDQQQEVPQSKQDTPPSEDVQTQIEKNESLDAQMQTDDSKKTESAQNTPVQPKCATCEKENAVQRQSGSEDQQTESSAVQTRVDEQEPTQPEIQQTVQRQSDGEGESQGDDAGDTAQQTGDQDADQPDCQTGEEEGSESDSEENIEPEGSDKPESAEAESENPGCGGEADAEQGEGASGGAGQQSCGGGNADAEAEGGEAVGEQTAQEPAEAEQQEPQIPPVSVPSCAETVTSNAATEAPAQQSETPSEGGESQGVCSAQSEGQTQVQTAVDESSQDQQTQAPVPAQAQNEQGGNEDSAAQSKEDEGETQALSAQAQENEVDEATSGGAENSVQNKKHQNETDNAQTHSVQCEKDDQVQQKADEDKKADSSVQTRALTVQARQQQKGKIAAKAIQNRGTGEALSPYTRERLESSVGVDLKHVRVHSDSQSHEANKGLSAKAFAHKNHIWLGRGQSPTDLKLMAHEVTHTVQQGSAGSQRVPSVKRSSENDESQRDVNASFEATADEGATQQTNNSSNNSSTLAQTSGQSESAGEAPLQSKSASTTGVKAGAAKKESEDIAPDEIDLMGKDNLDDIPESTEQWLIKKRKPWRTGYVKAKFGNIARGPVQITRKGKKRFSIYKRQSMPLQHPLFKYLGRVSADLQPRLFLYSKGRSLRGHVGITTGEKYKRASDFYKFLRKNQEMLGLSGLKLNIPGKTFELRKGKLLLGPMSLAISMGESFKGVLIITVSNEKIESYEGDVNVNIKGVTSGSVHIKQDGKGLVTGKGSLSVTVTKQFSGSVTVIYDGKLFSGSGIITYTGEKMTGKLTLNVVELSEEQRMVAQKKSAGEGAPATEEPPAKKKKSSDRFVLFGSGDLTFAFNDWLNGTANVVVDRKGFVTVIGKITPQKVFKLFDRKDLGKKLPKIGPFEARASYGIPVVGNVYVGASVELVPFAFIGPGVIKDIEVGGTYSTDPEKSNDFSIAATLYIPAAAGLSLTAKGKIGLVIAGHDISAGAGITAEAGIGGFVEAKPVIGYREKSTEGEDKKGEFFIKGDLTIAAQPYFGLKGFLFVELDSPWWSPAPDKTWRWPLFDKSWPLGDPLGITASMDYVVGSGEWPKVDVKKPKFDMDKFMSDMIDDNTEGKVSPKDKEKGGWKERNSKAAVPPKSAAPGLPSKAMVNVKGSSNAGKKTGTPIAKGGRTADGRKVADLKREAAKKGKKTDQAPASKTPAAGSGTPGKPPAKDRKKQAHDEQLASGIAALKQVAARYSKDGATRKEIVTGVKSVRRKFKVFKSIEVIDGGKTWDYKYVASQGVIPGASKKKIDPAAAKIKPGDTIVHIKQDLVLRVVKTNYDIAEGTPGVRASYTDRDAFMGLPYSTFNRDWNMPKIPPYEKFIAFGGEGQGGKVVIDKKHINAGTSANISKSKWTSIGYDPKGNQWNQAGHLVARSLGGPGGYTSGNIVPMTFAANKTNAGIRDIESSVLSDVKANAVYEYSAKPNYDKSKQVPPVSIVVNAKRKYPSTKVPSTVPGNGSKTVDNTV
ncbi:MAG TPA: DUF4157 domain-containing protein [Gammaproteobacteria bacterium]|nr:DUF4157 domain-containing protein [Gammaproteobacteria bacterium]